jgi:hypothetical protein
MLVRFRDWLLGKWENSRFYKRWVVGVWEQQIDPAPRKLSFWLGWSMVVVVCTGLVVVAGYSAGRMTAPARERVVYVESPVADPLRAGYVPAAEMEHWHSRAEMCEEQLLPEIQTRRVQNAPVPPVGAPAVVAKVVPKAKGKKPEPSVVPSELTKAGAWVGGWFQ